MVSPLWKASADGDLNAVLAILNDVQPVDIEAKDHTGATPLIEAVKNGHIEVVRVLLSKGADPTYASSQGRPEQFTSDPAIHELLRSAYPNIPDASQENTYANDDPTKGYYAPPPPGPYAYYPSINPVLSPMGDGTVYYPPPLAQPQQGGEHSPTSAGIGHLPPPEVARMIPCRYFPACRYGPQCMFAHPQGQYYPPNSAAAPPPPPHGQYPPFDPSMGPPYGYYPAPPPPQPFQQPNGAPMSPPPHPPHVMHGRSPSEIVSPSQGHFPNGAPPPMSPYGPNGYPLPGPVPVPMSVPQLPPMHHQPPPPSGPIPQSPTAVYSNGPVAPFPGPDNQYYPPPPPPHMAYSEVDGKMPGPNGQPDGFGPHAGLRDNHGPRRGGVARRGSFLNKQSKPPCMFFPSGRCKNGDDCRFPHVLPDNSGPNHTHNYFAPRGGAPRPRGPNHVNGMAAITQKMGNMTMRDDAPRPQNGATDGSSRSQSSDPGNRPKFHQGPHKHLNGHINKRVPGSAPIRPQRVPSAEDFPVLPGSITPPSRNGVNGVNGTSGPTAAQVLQAPPPIRKDNSKDSSNSSLRGASPEPTPTLPEESKIEAAKPIPAQDSSQIAPASAPLTQKFPLSFAAAAAATAANSAATEAPKEVSVSA